MSKVNNLNAALADIRAKRSRLDYAEAAIQRRLDAELAKQAQLKHITELRSSPDGQGLVTDGCSSDGQLQNCVDRCADGRHFIGAKEANELLRLCCDKYSISEADRTMVEASGFLVIPALEKRGYPSDVEKMLSDSGIWSMVGRNSQTEGCYKEWINRCFNS